MLGRFSGLKRWLGVLACMALAIELLAVVSPFFMKWVIDEALVSADRDLSLIPALGLLFMLMLRVTVSAMRGAVHQRTTARFVAAGDQLERIAAAVHAVVVEVIELAKVPVVDLVAEPVGQVQCAQLVELAGHCLYRVLDDAGPGRIPVTAHQCRDRRAVARQQGVERAKIDIGAFSERCL
jgi:ABC-type multidrug transport system fused ATPase/permease subunit